MALLNLVKVATATTGTGTMTLGAAESGFLTMALAGAVNGATYSYGISDGANSEVGTGVYSTTGPTLTRTVLKSTNANALINLSGTAKVFITALAEDLDPKALGSSSDTIYSTTSPSTPTAGLKMYAQQRAGRIVPGYISPTGRTERLQHFLGSNARVEHSYNGTGTTYSTWGSTFTVTSTTAATAQTLAATSFMTQQKRIQIGGTTNVSVGTVFAPQTIGFRSNNTANAMIASWRFGTPALPTTARMFVGFTASTAVIPTADITTMANIFGIGMNAAETSWVVKHNGTGTHTSATVLTNTGTVSTMANCFFQIDLWSSPANTGSMGYRVTRWSTTGVETNDEGMITATAGASGGLPALNVGLVPHLWFSNSAATTLQIHYQQTYIEID